MADKLTLVGEIEAVTHKPTMGLWRASRTTLEGLLESLKRPQRHATSMLDGAEMAMATWRNAVPDMGGFDADDLAYLLAGMRHWAKSAGLDFEKVSARSATLYRYGNAPALWSAREQRLKADAANVEDESIASDAAIEAQHN